MKKKEMRKIFEKNHIFVELFGISVYFTTCKEEFTHMCEWIKQEAETNVDGRCMLNRHDSGVVNLYIGWFTNKESALVHECTHAALFIADAIGHSVASNDEIVPYLTGYIFDKCKEKLVENNDEPKSTK